MFLNIQIVYCRIFYSFCRRYLIIFKKSILETDELPYCSEHPFIENHVLNEAYMSSRHLQGFINLWENIYPIILSSDCIAWYTENKIHTWITKLNTSMYSEVKDITSQKVYIKDIYWLKYTYHRMKLNETNAEKKQYFQMKKLFLL